MSRRILDAHTHVDPGQTAPVQSLLADMDANGIAAGVLIVNTEEELAAVQKDADTLTANRERFHLVAGVDIHREDPFAIECALSAMGFSPDWKLHPKLFRYTKEDFEAIASAVSGTKARNIVIDTLYFGEQLENHIGTELGICLAQTFPEKRIVLAHAGSVRLLECQMYTRNLTNIVYDLSFTSAYLNHTSVRYDMVNFLKYTSGRIMFGADYPSFDMKRAIDSFRELCLEAGLSEQAMEKVFYQNAEEVYLRNER